MTAPGSIPRRSLSSHLAAWIVVGIIVGWFVAYIGLRLGGDNPATAALPALIIGGIGGIIVATLGVAWARRREAAGQPIGHRRVREVKPTKMSSRDLELVRQVWPLLLGAAAVAAVVALLLLVHWLGIHGARPKSTLLMFVWDGVLAAWLLDEGLRIRQFVFDGMDSLYFGCLLTVILAGIGISRDMVAGGQVVLIVAVGVAAFALAALTWRLAGARLFPVAGAAAVVVAALSLIIPLVS